MRRFAIASALLCLLAIAGGTGEPAGGGKPKKEPGKEKKKAGAAARGTGSVARLDITPKHARAVKRALDFLAKQQSKDGSFNTSRRGFGGGHRAAMTGLAGLALLSGGHVPGRGKHAKVVEKAAKFLRKLQDREGCYADVGGRSMHGHGYALHFMAECYGMTTDPKFAAKLRKSVKNGVRLTARCQSPEGGWYYQPVARGHEGSIAITQVQAIWAARQAGINVPQKTIDKGIKYMAKSQCGDGGIAYMMGMKRSTPALSVAGVMIFCGLGKRESREATKAIAYMRKRMATYVKGSASGHRHYTDFYFGQALYQAGDPDWSKNFPKLRDRIIKGQAADGSLGGTTGYGKVFSTSCQVMVLTIPYQYLPTFQR
jgi:hypothetical protein